MAGNWGNIAQAAVNGYLQGRRIVRDDEEYAADKKYRDRVRASQVRKLDKEDKLDADLSAAGRSAAVTERVVKPDYMDNRDVGQPGEAPMVAGMGTPAVDAASAGAGAAGSMASSAADSNRAAAAASLADAAAADQAVAQRAAAARDAGATAVADPVAPAAAPVAMPAAAPQAPVGVTQYEVGGTTFANRAAAEAAANAQNSREGRLSRMSDAYMNAGMPDQALALDSKRASLAKSAEELREKGVFEGLKQFRFGNKDGAVKALKASGLFKVGEGDITLTPVERELPGVGKQKTYDLTFPMVGDDGKTTPFTINSHDASMAMMDYAKALELGRKATDTDSKAENRIQQLGIATQRLELQQAIGEARIAKMQGGGGGGGRGAGEKSDRETRLTLQATQTSINREISETNRAISERMKDLPRAAQAGDPQLQALIKQQSALTAQRDAVQGEMVNLVEKKVGGEAAAPMRKEAPAKAPAKGSDGTYKVQSRADYEALPAGAVYVHPKTGEKLVKGKK